MSKINPKWLSYNNLQNEGGEGYNPHPKWVNDDAPVATVSSNASAPAKIYRDSRGMHIDPIALIAEAEARLTRLSDVFAIASVKRSIDAYRNMLEG